MICCQWKRRWSKWAVVALLLVAAPAAAELRVFACEPEWAALSAALGGDRVSVDMATTAAQDPHYVQARPGLIALARRADLLVCTGADLEAGWLPLLLRKSGNPVIQPARLGHFLAAEQVSLLEVPERLDRALGDIHAAGNPHLALDPWRVLVVAERLAERLAAIDPEGAVAYREHLGEFRNRWRAAIAEWEMRAAPLRGRRVATHHPTFTYLEDWLGLERVAMLEPKPGIPPSSAHLARLLEKFRAAPVDLILHASYEDARPAGWLAGKIGVPVLRLPASPEGPPDGVETLESWMESLVAALLQTTGLGGR
jgi:zinc/manganese transport system substrate-binding protein